MKDISEEEKAMYIYALHIVLYANDMAINSFKSLQNYIKDKDKESKKIYNALRKRVRAYEKDIANHFKGNDAYFYADFSGYMDDYFDNDVEGLRRSAEWIFRCNGYTDTRYCSKIEESFSLICFSISIANSYISGLKKNGARTFILPEYKLDEMKKIFENLYDWTMLLQHKEKVLDLSKYKSIKKYFERLKENITSREIFEKAYSYALEEEKERNNK